MTPRSGTIPTDLQSPLQEHLPVSSQEAAKNGHLPEVESEEISYTPVPPRRSTTVTVRYQLRGRGRPLPYPVEDDEL